MQSFEMQRVGPEVPVRPVVLLLLTCALAGRAHAEADVMRGEPVPALNLNRTAPVPHGPIGVRSNLPEGLTSRRGRAMRTGDDLDKLREGFPQSFIVQPGPPVRIVGPSAPPPLVLRRNPQEILDQVYGDVVAVGRQTGYHCSGVLVAPRAVLTARHCLPATQVLFGHDIRTPELIATPVRAITPFDPQVDAALLELSASIRLPQRPRRGNRDQQPPFGAVRLVGFGANDTSGSSGYGIKRSTDVPVLGWGCDGYRARSTGCDPAWELLIPRSGDRDTCDGDSGGPVLEWHGGRWTLLGITSRPVAAARLRCGAGGIYLRADRLTPWLDEQLRAISEKANP